MHAHVNFKPRLHVHVPQVSSQLHTIYVYPTLLLVKNPGTYWTGGSVGPKNPSGWFGEEENLLPLAGFESRIVQTVAYSLYRLLHPDFPIYKQRNNVGRCTVVRILDKNFMYTRPLVNPSKMCKVKVIDAGGGGGGGGGSIKHFIVQLMHSII